MPRVVLLTALPLEYQAVRAHMSNLQSKKYNDTHYEVGTFSTLNQSLEVLLRLTGQGTDKASSETQRALTYFEPQIAMYIGVAGGIKDVSLGDIVVGTKVYGVEGGKAAETFHPRPEAFQSHYPLVEQAQTEALKFDWTKRIKDVPFPAQPPRVFVAPLATGDKVVAASQAPAFQLLKSNYSDALAVEMEGVGFLTAVHSHQKVMGLVIRGVSDLIDGKEAADKSNWQARAAAYAAAFAFEVLYNFAFNLETDPYATKEQSDTSPNITISAGRDMKNNVLIIGNNNKVNR